MGAVDRLLPIAKCVNAFGDVLIAEITPLFRKPGHAD
jgi:hypothetical protein